MEIQSAKIQMYEAILKTTEQRTLPAKEIAKRYREATNVLEKAVDTINEIINK